MRSGLYPRLRRAVGMLMLAVMALFAMQSAMITASQAAAALGVMPQPAVAFSGAIHVHDGLAGHAHIHASNAAGHVHDAANLDNDDDTNAAAPLVSLCCTAAVMPAVAAETTSLAIARRIEAAPHDALHGVEPGRLNRPPSTPDIA
jgi:hypothetical protein